MGKNEICFGILGASKISIRAIIEPASMVSGIVVCGIAARDFDRAREMSKNYNIETAYPDYASLVRSDKINTVYISTANHLHKKWIVEAANHKKNILVEKPICINSSDLEEIEKAVYANKVYLLEAIMAQYHPWQNKMKEIISSNSYGRLREITTTFTFTMHNDQDNYRLYPEMGGGVFYDLASYWVQLIQYCIPEEPEELNGYSRFDGENGIDRTFNANITYPSGIKANFYGSFDEPLKAEHLFLFDTTKLRIRNFLKPTLGRMTLSIDVLSLSDEKLDKISFQPENYYINQLNHLRNNIQHNRTGIETGAKERVRMMEKIFLGAKNKR